MSRNAERAATVLGQLPAAAAPSTRPADGKEAPASTSPSSQISRAAGTGRGQPSLPRPAPRRRFRRRTGAAWTSRTWSCCRSGGSWRFRTPRTAGWPGGFCPRCRIRGRWTPPRRTRCWTVATSPGSRFSGHEDHLVASVHGQAKVGPRRRLVHGTRARGSPAPRSPSPRPVKSGCGRRSPASRPSTADRTPRSTAC